MQLDNLGKGNTMSKRERISVRAKEGKRKLNLKLTENMEKKVFPLPRSGETEKNHGVLEDLQEKGEGGQRTQCCLNRKPPEQGEKTKVNRCSTVRKQRVEKLRHNREKNVLQRLVSLNSKILHLDAGVRRQDIRGRKNFADSKKNRWGSQQAERLKREWDSTPLPRERDRPIQCAAA